MYEEPAVSVKLPLVPMKEQLRRAGAAIGIPLLFLTVFSKYWLYLLCRLLALFGISPVTVIAFLRENGIQEAIQIVLSVILFIVPFSFSAWGAKKRVGDLIPTQKVPLQKGLPLFFFGVGVCAFANIAVSIAGQIFSFMGMEYSVDFGESPQGIYGFFLSVLATAVAPALVEEYATRGIVMGLLKPFGDGFSILVSAILFGVMHRNFEQMPFAFLVGLVLGFVRIATGSIWLCCLIHAFNNLISVIFDYCFAGLTVAETNAVYVVFLMILLLLGTVSLLFFRKENENLFSLSTPEDQLPRGKKYRWFFSSIWILLFLVSAFWQACQFFVL